MKLAKTLNHIVNNSRKITFTFLKIKEVSNKFKLEFLKESFYNFIFIEVPHITLKKYFSKSKNLSNDLDDYIYNVLNKKVTFERNPFKGFNNSISDTLKLKGNAYIILPLYTGYVEKEPLLKFFTYTLKNDL